MCGVMSGPETTNTSIELSVEMTLAAIADATQKLML